MSNNKYKCSFKQYSDSIPKSSRYRLFKDTSKNNYVYLMIPINHDHLLVKEKRYRLISEDLKDQIVQ